MMKNLLRPGLEAAKATGLDLLTASGVDGFEPGWARPYATDPFSPYWYASGDDDEDDEEEEDDKGEKDDEEDDEDDDDEDKGKTPEELAAEGKRRSEEHTHELQSIMRISYAVFHLKTKTTKHNTTHQSKHPTT